jgi:hypothetical protein
MGSIRRFLALDLGHGALNMVGEETLALGPKEIF